MRVIDSLQLTDRLPQIATPANWVVSLQRFELLFHMKFEYLTKPGEKVMILPTVNDTEADQLFNKEVDRVGMPSGIQYLRTTTNY